MRRALRGAARAACLAAAAAGMAGALAGCGLEILPYLNPPGNPIGPATPSTPVFQIVYTTSDNVPEFLGFELYYKFYTHETDVQVGFSTIDQLQSAGFRRVLGPNDTLSSFAPPLVRVPAADRSSNFTSYAYFNYSQDSSSSLAPYFQYSGPSAPGSQFVLFRDVQDPNQNAGVPKTFACRNAADSSPNYLSTDADLVGVTLTSGSHIYIAIYAFSYGQVDVSTPLYSSATSLGYTYISIP